EESPGLTFAKACVIHHSISGFSLSPAKEARKVRAPTIRTRIESLCRNLTDISGTPDPGFFQVLLHLELRRSRRARSLHARDQAARFLHLAVPRLRIHRSGNRKTRLRRSFGETRFNLLQKLFVSVANAYEVSEPLRLRYCRRYHRETSRHVLAKFQ